MNSTSTSAGGANGEAGHTIVVDVKPASRYRQLCQALRRQLRGSQYILGVILILCVTVIWVAASEWIQFIFGELKFSKPYFLTYFNTTGFCFWNAGFLVSSAWRRIPLDDTNIPQPIFIDDPDLVFDPVEVPANSQQTNPLASTEDGFGDASSAFQQQPPHRYYHRRARARAATEVTVVSLADPGVDHHRDPQRGGGGPLTDAPAQAHVDRSERDRMVMLDQCMDFSPASSVCSEDSFVDIEMLPIDGSHAACNGADIPQPATVVRLRVERIRPYSLLKIWRCAVFFCPLWFIANYLFNLSLSRTSVASNTILSSTSFVWTLALSFILLRQPVGPLRLFAVALSISGSVMVAVSGGGSIWGESNSVAGDMVALVAAFFYAAYTVVLKHNLPEDARYPMGALFGAVGVINIIFLWTGLVFLHVTGWERFQVPSAAQLWPLFLNALIGTNLSDVLWARGVVLTSPLVATLGLSITTPLAMVVDAILHKQRFSGLYIAGAVLVVVGFVLCNIRLNL